MAQALCAPRALRDFAKPLVWTPLLAASLFCGAMVSGRALAAQQPGGPPPAEANPSAAPAPLAVDQPFSLDKLVFEGGEPYTDAELRPLTGLAVGATITTADLAKASQALVDTGLIADAQVALATQDNVHTVTLTLKAVPPSQLARASFANLVWFTPTEIEQYLRSHVPLYRGGLPPQPESPLTGAVQAALIKMLAPRAGTVTMTHLLLAPSPQHPYEAMEFRVTSPPVKLFSATVNATPGALIQAELKAEADVVALPYNEGIAGTTIEDVLLAPVRHAGYVSAALENIERQRRSGDGEVLITYIARLNAGPVYRVRKVTFVSTPLYSAADFLRESPLHAGGIPTDTALLAAQQPILNVYRAQGYLNAEVHVETKLDPATAAASYTFSVTPGEQYRVHTVTTQGLPAAAQAEFDSAWTLKAGDLYNDLYIQDFLQNNRQLKLLSGYTYSYSATSNSETHLVDLTLNFKPAR